MFTTLTRHIQSKLMLYNSCCMFGCRFGWCVCGLDFELVFSCECVGREEMLTGRSKVLTSKETVPEIRHGSIETSTYSGKRKKHALIYTFKEIVSLKENKGYYFPLYLSYSIYFCLSFSLSHTHTHTHTRSCSHSELSHTFQGCILNSDTHNECVIVYDAISFFG